MAGIFSQLIDFMEEGEWKYEIIEGQTLLRFEFKGSAGRVLCYADVDEDKGWLVFYSYLPVNATADKMSEMAEFVARANRGMRIGNFELDYDDGEIRYKTSIDIEGGELTSTMVDNLLRANLSTMFRYFPGMMRLIFGDRPARDLIEEIEGRGAAEDEFAALEDDGDEPADFEGHEFPVDDDEGEEFRQAG